MFYPRGQPPVCPECGGERVVWWGHGHAHYSPNEGAGLDLGNVDPRYREMASTRSGLRDLQRELSAINGKHVEFETPSASRHVERDERRHREIEWRKSQGRDMKEVQERIDADKARSR